MNEWTSVHTIFILFIAFNTAVRVSIYLYKIIMLDRKLTKKIDKQSVRYIRMIEGLEERMYQRLGIIDQKIYELHKTIKEHNKNKEK